MKLNKTAVEARQPGKVLLNRCPTKILIRNPTKGLSKSINTKIVSIYPFRFFNFSISIEPIFLNKATRIANPTATSAAATVIPKIANI